MARIGTFQLPDATVFDSRCEYVLGRVRRIVKLTSFFTRFANRESFASTLDDLERELERFDRGETDLSIHEGRFLDGRRRKWTLTRDDDRCVGVGVLEILANDRYERSESENQESVSITSSPQVVNLAPSGNWNALPVLELTATVALTNPSFSDGPRTIECNLTLNPGESLALDSEERTAVKNGVTNVLSFVSGEFVELDPGGATLTYQDETGGGPQASLAVKWRDRWV